MLALRRSLPAHVRERTRLAHADQSRHRSYPVIPEANIEQAGIHPATRGVILDITATAGLDCVSGRWGAVTGSDVIFQVLSIYRKARRTAVAAFLWSVAAVLCMGFIYLWFAGNPARHDPGVQEAAYDYLPDAQRLLEEERYAEFFSIGRFVQANPDLPHHDEIVALYEATEAEYYGWFTRAKRFMGGFLTGDTESTESMAGTVISDFLVIGDVRDLGIEGYHAATGQDVDYFVATLSGIGFLATAATVFPEPASSGAGVSGQCVLSILKGLKRVKALTPRMADEVLTLARRAADARSLKPMMACLENTAAVAKHAPSGAIPVVMRRVDSVDDMRHVADWLRAAPDETVVAMVRGGDGTLKGLLHGTPSKTALTAALRSTTRVVRPTARGTKFFFRGRPAVVLQRMAEEAARKPMLRYSFLAAGVLLGLMLLRRLVRLGVQVLQPRAKDGSAGNA